MVCGVVEGTRRNHMAALKAVGQLYASQQRGHWQSVRRAKTAQA
jgi:hypothetical protein